MRIQPLEVECCLHQLCDNQADTALLADPVARLLRADGERHGLRARFVASQARYDGSLIRYVAASTRSTQNGVDLLIWCPRGRLEDWRELPLEVRLRFPNRPIGIIAVADVPVDRLRGADALVPFRDISASLPAAVVRTTRAHLYRQKPLKRSVDVSYECRRITNGTDLLASMRLRYDVFSLLNYIPPEFLSRAYQIELDNFDKYSVPFGCFRNSPSKRLIGTTRLITQQFQPEYAAAIVQMLDRFRDAALKRSLATPYFQERPVFQSMPLESLQHTLFQRGRRYCEVSRVIVHEDFRGAGLSTALLQHALEWAAHAGLDLALLACVPGQTYVYQRVGFVELDLQTVFFGRVDQPARAMYRQLR